MAANGISELATKAERQTAKLDIAQLKRRGYTLYADGTINSGSAQFSGSNYLSIATSTSFGFGTGDFTFEGWYYHTAGGAFHVLFDFRTTITQVAILVAVNTSDKIYLYVNGSIQTITTASLTTDTWVHVALVRSVGTTALWVNGTQSGTPYTDTNDYGTTYPLHMGSDFNHANRYTGNISNIRIVKGTALYTGTFTPSRSPFTAVTGTQLLLNTDDGANFLTDSSTNNFTVTNTGTVTTSSLSPSPDTAAVFYRVNNTYDLALLPDTYATTADDNANTGGLLQGRPWVNYAGITFAANIWRTDYELYFNDTPSFFATAALKAAPNDYNGTDTTISEPSLLNTTSIEYKGYFLATYTGTHTFYLSSDDGSYMWVGATALTGFTTANALVQNGGLHAVVEVSATISLVAGTYYPIRIQFGNGPAGPGALIASYAHSGQAKTSTWTGKVFYNTATNGF